MRCVIEGWPDGSDIAPDLRAALAALVIRQTAGWDIPVAVVPAAGCLRIEADAAGWPQLAMLAGLAMRMCATRPMWLWHISDDDGVLAARLAPALCAWRGMYVQVTGAPSQWSPAAVTRAPALDEAVRGTLAEAAPEVIAALGIRAPAVATAAAKTTALQLFEFIPEGNWMRGGQAVSVGRSMVQVDGRQELHRIKGRVEIGNSGALPLDAARVQITLRGAGGELLGAVSGEAPGLPVGSVRLITIEGELPLGRLMTARIDIGCQAIAQTTASFSARILEV